jgi:peptide/nickel transport system permease protein
MIRFAVRRLGWALFTAAIASVVAFALFWMIPNVDPSYNLGGGRQGTEETRERATEQYGLDDPLPVQYANLMEGIFNGDVECFYGCGSLRTAFLEALPVTFWLVVGTAAIAIGAGVALALICVRNRGRWIDRAITTVATMLYSIPSLVLGAVLWAYLALEWGVFPSEGYVPLTEDPIQWLYHLLLPWIAGAVPFIGAYTHFVRASLLDSADRGWVRTARAKGLSEREVLRRHVLRNGLIPPVNLWGLDFSHAFGGFVLYIEVIFGLPGIGKLTADTLAGLDLPPLVGLAVYLAIVVVFVSALVDVLMAWLDPTLRDGDAVSRPV